MNVRTGLLAALIVGAIFGAFVAGIHAPPALGQRADQGQHHYSVVETEGHNLIVADDTTNKLYFYTIDKEKEIGSELRLRGTVDLNEVGKPLITPKHYRAEK